MAAGDINVLLAFSLKKKVFLLTSLLSLQTAVLSSCAPFEQSSSKDSPYSLSPASLLAWVPKHSGGLWVHFSYATFFCQGYQWLLHCWMQRHAPMAATNQQHLMEKITPSSLIDVPLASGQHISLVSSCLNSCFFPASVTSVPDL